MAGDLARVGPQALGSTRVAPLVAKPVGTLAAGRAAVQATAPGARPVQGGAADDAARGLVTKDARSVTRLRAHATA